MLVKHLIHILEENADALFCIVLQNGDLIPEHFHITEIGRVNKLFIDCGGVIHETTTCLLQVWTANDIEHRLNAGKLAKLLRIADKAFFDLSDLPVEVEYGIEAASQYSISDIDTTPDRLFITLTGKKTDCLAPDKCGVNKCGNGCC